MKDAMSGKSPAAQGGPEDLEREEAILRRGLEQRYEMGRALQRIKDRKLYQSAGYAEWMEYMRKRVKPEFGIGPKYAQKLMLAAKIRPRLPDLPPAPSSPSGDDGRTAGDAEDWGWRPTEVLEFARFAPKTTDYGRNKVPTYDTDAIDTAKVDRVAKKVIDHVKKTGQRPTRTTVRDFVDAELGVDREAEKAQAAAEKRRHQDVLEEMREPPFWRYLQDLTQSIREENRRLGKVNPDGWALFFQSERAPTVLVNDLREAAQDLLAILEKGQASGAAKASPRRVGGAAG